MHEAEYTEYESIYIIFKSKQNETLILFRMYCEPSRKARKPSPIKLRTMGWDGFGLEWDLSNLLWTLGRLLTSRFLIG